MKLGISEIKRTIEDCKTMGYDLRVADIFYTFALQGFKDKNVIYAALFGKGASDEDVNEYDTSSKMKFLKKYMKSNFFKVEQEDVQKDEQHEDITFEENKAYMLKLKKKTEEALEKGEIEKKDGLKILADLSVKLNDKFAVSEKQDEQRIIVYPKFSTICETTRKECWLQTKEFAMEHWGLIEDPNKDKNNIQDDDDE